MSVRSCAWDAAARLRMSVHTHKNTCPVPCWAARVAVDVPSI